MKILHLISSGGMYGAEAVVLTLSRQLQNMGHQVEIACFMNEHRPNTEFIETTGRTGFKAHVIRCRSRIDLKTIKALRRLIVEGEYDLVHSHNYKSDIYLRLATLGLPIPIFATCHSWYDNHWKVWLYGAFDRFLLRFFRAVISVSPGVTEQLRHAGISGPAVTEISNGIAVERYQNRHAVLRKELKIPSHKVIVGIVARLSKEKGIHYFLDVVATLGCDAETFAFVLVGDGPERENLLQQAQRLGIAEKICFLGRREDMPEIFASIDILLQPSLSEGLPMSVLEAMAAGCTVIATRVGALPSVLVQNESGILISPANPIEMMTALKRVGMDPTLRAQLGGAAHRRVQSCFSAEEMTRQYFAVYQTAFTPISAERQMAGSH